MKFRGVDVLPYIIEAHDPFELENMIQQIPYIHDLQYSTRYTEGETVYSALLLIESDGNMMFMSEEELEENLKGDTNLN